MSKKNMNKVSKKLLIVIILICIIYTILFLVAMFELKVSASGVRDKVLYKDRTAYVFIGDSRTVGMDNAIGLHDMYDTFVVAKSGMGYDWFMKTGSEELNTIREQNKNTYTKWIYIFNLGVNDLSNVENYKELYKELSNEEDTVVYYLSINPTDDSVGGIQCSSIEEFNKKIYIEAYHNYINGYQYLKDIRGYTFDKRQDGMHYSDETYKDLYEFIMLSIDVRRFVEDNDNRYSAYYYLYNIR